MWFLMGHLRIIEYIGWICRMGIFFIYTFTIGRLTGNIIKIHAGLEEGMTSNIQTEIEST